MTMGNQIKSLVSGSVMDITVVSMCISLKTFRNFPNWKTKIIYSWIQTVELTEYGDFPSEIQL